ncbi:xanthine dehydrogenase small subunit [Candidatus Thiothrix sp. Deng01]|uniref:Xanthine dehydrogenase small subunit n=1 Tax=Candidatus Thiothrix phosphatis TaxID=3112415 RepID=A0ABU6D329_9GAMM|nr:xanthine dehydrogenase small subunit [Candidatus Thiothrix sp. Deng01]MEB4593222.1 xanthine dehydrogenase small subunit [Candidatus Thiothrix sp. Deng01]
MSVNGTAAKQTITFMLDGQKHTPQPFAPDTTLLNYLREHLDRRGTKEGCAEGDCGACTVVAADLHRGQLRHRSLNACVQLLATLDGKALFTVESLQRGQQLHPAQQAMVDHHGSQCGFCTPGFVMSLFALYHNQPNASREQVSQALSGNLCRCTGYRPILDAGERMYGYGFAVAADADQAMLDTLQEWADTQQALAIEQDGKRFFAPTSLEALAGLLEQYPSATLLAGATDVGLWITKQHRDLPVIISLAKVAGLETISEQDGWLEIAAAVSLEEAFQALVKHYPQLSELHERFASLPIRNAGTLVGNIANGSPIGDSMPALMVLGARIRLRQGDAVRELALEDFYLGYQQKDLRAGEFVEAVRIPLPTSADANSLVRCYKLSKRFEQDISAVCAAFHIKLDAQRQVTQARIAYGGMAAVPQRAAHCEAALLGQPWEQASVTAAMQALEQDFKPLSDMRASSAYRMATAKNLLLKSLLESEGQQLSLYRQGAQA